MALGAEDRITRIIFLVGIGGARVVVVVGALVVGGRSCWLGELGLGVGN